VIASIILAQSSEGGFFSLYRPILGNGAELQVRPSRQGRGWGALVILSPSQNPDHVHLSMKAWSKASSNRGYSYIHPIGNLVEFDVAFKSSG
jgi:hypothetical protein